MRCSTLTCLALLLVVSPRVAAAPPTTGLAEARARAYFEKGHGLFDIGDFHGAIHEWAAGYELSHKALFLVDLGQAYRRLGELVRARELYERFLREAVPDDPARASVRALLEELAQAAPPLVERSVPPPAPSPPLIAPMGAVASPARSPAPARPDRRRGLIAGLVVGGILLVAGAATAIALTANRDPSGSLPAFRYASSTP